MKKGIAILLIWSGLILSVSVVSTAQAGKLPDDERLLKAVFIFNFAKLTRWPQQTWSKPGDPFSLCIAGTDQLASDLQYLSGKTIKARPVVISVLQNQQELPVCHLLYVASSEKDDYKDLLDRLENRPVLTVSSIPGFAHRRGIIELYSEDDRTRFIIHLNNSKKRRLEISSRLLRLARVIGWEELP